MLVWEQMQIAKNITDSENSMQTICLIYSNLLYLFLLIYNFCNSFLIYFCNVLIAIMICEFNACSHVNIMPDMLLTT